MAKVEDNQDPELASPAKKRKQDSDNGGKKSKKQRDANATREPTQGLTNEISENRAALDIVVEGEEDGVIFAPVMRFEDSGMLPTVMTACQSFTKPSPVQAQCWPIVLSGRDVVGIAATGSGKTLAYALPGLNRLIQAKGKPKVSILVLAPTRELAIQIFEVYNQAGSACGVKCVCVYGGVSKNTQRQNLKGASVVIATPGRLLDFLDEGTFELGSVNYMVLDEADRMLDMGFENDVRRVFSMITGKHQTVMFSATWPTSIQALARDLLSNPVKVTIGSANLSASHTVKQIVEVVEPHQKESRLHQLLTEYHKKGNRVLVFCLYKKEAARVEQVLQQRKWKAIAIHGDMMQAARERALEAFKNGTSPILVATDVAARGLDIKNVEYVINVTFPLTVEDYVHRIGRTGRAGQSGVSHTLFSAQEKGLAGALINVLRETNQPVPEELLKFGSGVKRKEHKMYGNHFRDDSDETGKATHKTFDDDD